MQRKVKQNIWGNWCGYVGRNRVAEFGTDEIAAGYWIETGIVDFNAGYGDADKYKSIAFSGAAKQ
jgi:hypothetical protein